MAIKEYTDLTDGIKHLQNPNEFVIVYDENYDILFESDNVFPGQIFTPAKNKIKYGTKEEIEKEKEDKELKEIKE